MSHPLRNLIGVSGPHLPDINIAMGWAAIGLLVALLSSGGWKTRRGLLAVVTIVLATLPSAPLWRYLTPLAWLQFPWRWMFPATLLATTAILDEAPSRGRLRLAISLAAMVVPLDRAPPCPVRTRSLSHCENRACPGRRTGGEVVHGQPVIDRCHGTPARVVGRPRTGVGAARSAQDSIVARGQRSASDQLAASPENGRGRERTICNPGFSAPGRSPLECPGQRPAGAARALGGCSSRQRSVWKERNRG